MQKQSRRSLIKNAVAAGAAVAGAAVSVKSLEAQVSGKLEKKSYSDNTAGDNVAAGGTPLFSSAVSHSNLRAPVKPARCSEWKFHTLKE